MQRRGKFANSYTKEEEEKIDREEGLINMAMMIFVIALITTTLIIWPEAIWEYVRYLIHWFIVLPITGLVVWGIWKSADGWSKKSY